MLFLFETVLQIMHYHYSPITLKMDNITAKTDFRNAHAFEDVYTTYDAKLLWKARAGSRAFNDQGFIGREINNTNAQYYRIIVIGDSNVAGIPLNPITWPEALNQELEKNNHKVIVLNAGMWGYSAYQGLERFKQVESEYKPDMILVSFGSNDAQQVKISDKSWRGASTLQNITVPLIEYSKVAQFILSITDRIRARSGGNTTLTPRVSVADYKTYLEEMILGSRKYNTTIVLLTRPYRFFPGERENPDPTVWKTYAADYRNATIAIGEKYNVTVIDVYALFENKTEYFRDESHFTDEGASIAGELIAKQIDIPIMTPRTTN